MIAQRSNPQEVGGLREVELKFRLENPGEMVSRLEGLGCRPGPPVEEVSFLLDAGDGSLVDSGRTLRVRRSGDRVFLTAKGPRRGSGPAKDRTELEVEVASGVRSLLALLGLVGLRPGLSYRRQRRTCNLRGTTVCLDTMDFGTYMEIEAGSPRELGAACRLLGLDPEDGEERSYPELMVLYGEREDG